ncbi:MULTISPECIES: hypothetical protein [Rhodopirellula]|jgi:hypothetical protein|uniref:hypothetical protein n=1 Tax=Rhodopirellula TaxID=265488 RepID=UPI0025807F21|nr:hypothetical protein [Rhodopirellula sp. UBA1907]MCR9211650.1 hypothetical protein [bacterium]|tara:strand:- start:17729 stop:17908 length:180 start_codon:yes stop_codon:yes gene_type:complete
MKKTLALLFSSCLLLGGVTGCDDSGGTVVAPDSSETSTDVPGGEMSEEEYAKELEKSMR